MSLDTQYTMVIFNGRTFWPKGFCQQLTRVDKHLWVETSCHWILTVVYCSSSDISLSVSMKLRMHLPYQYVQYTAVWLSPSPQLTKTFEVETSRVFTLPVAYSARIIDFRSYPHLTHLKMSFTDDSSHSVARISGWLWFTCVVLLVRLSLHNLLSQPLRPLLHAHAYHTQAYLAQTVHSHTWPIMSMGLQAHSSTECNTWCQFCT